jgi:hypothetical protein
MNHLSSSCQAGALFANQLSSANSSANSILFSSSNEHMTYVLVVLLKHLCPIKQI